MDTNDDFENASRLEQLGDAALSQDLPAAEHYRAAQLRLMPAGTVWSDREEYQRRMDAFERLQQKLYGLDGTGRPRKSISVGQFTVGMQVRVLQSFRDYDGQEIAAGEVLHFLDSSYFPYEGGYTLRFAEKIIRLADMVDEHAPIIANKSGAWFEVRW